MLRYDDAASAVADVASATKDFRSRHAGCLLTAACTQTRRAIETSAPS
jgi:hypothetical protein